MTNTPSTPLNYHLRACREKNPELLKEAFELEGRFLGTDDSENWTASQLVELLQQSSSGWKMTIQHRKIYSLQPTLVLSTLAEFLEFLDHKEYGPLRSSGVLAKCKDGCWRIRSYHLSFSVPNHAVKNTNLLELLAQSS